MYSLRAFGDYAKARGLATHVALSRSDVPPVAPPTAITVYSKDELERFVGAALGVDIRWWAFLVFLVDTGRRVGEALSLEWDWFRMHDSPAYVELPTTKTHQPQYVPLTRRLRTDVFTEEVILRLTSEVRHGRRQFARSPLVHPFPWTYSSCYKRFAAFCERTGLPNRGFHNFRHTVITARLASGMPLQAVSALAGHSSVAVTDRRYNHTTALSYAHLIDGEP